MKILIIDVHVPGEPPWLRMDSTVEVRKWNTKQLHT